MNRASIVAYVLVIEEAAMVRLGELMMILELHRQGVSVTAIARRTGRDPKTVRKYIERGIEAPAYGPRAVGRPSKLASYMDFVRERVTAFPELSAARLTREIRELGYAGAYTAVKRYLAAMRPFRTLLFKRPDTHHATDPTVANQPCREKAQHALGIDPVGFCANVRDGLPKCWRP